MDKVKTTLLGIGYAPLKISDGTITYDKPTWFISENEGGRDFTAEPNGEDLEIYGDGKVVYSANLNNGYNIKVTTIDVLDETRQAWYNETAINGGTAEYANRVPRSRFALFAIYDTIDGAGLTEIYYNCFASGRLNRGGKTSEGNFDPQFPEHSISSRPRETDNCVCIKIAGKERFTSVPEPQTAEG